jgi:glycosyltransferase involved in cell wall biosynthesis
MKASIIIINYNDKIRVGRAIESAINQTYKDTEVVVVDDGSDNETKEIYKRYEGKIKFVEVLRTDKNARTPSYARNCGFNASSGDYISFLDSDNYYSSDFVEKMIKNHYDVAMCNWEIIGKQQYKVNIENVWKHNQDDLRNYLQFTHLDHQCLMVKREVLKGICDNDEITLYDSRLPRSQDCDLIVRLMLNGNRFKLVPDNLFTFEKHEDDQMKTIASIHGKTLWTLKNSINIAWLAPMLNSMPLALSYVKAIQEFRTSPKWKKEYESNGFKDVDMDHDRLLKDERSEKIPV